MCHRASIASEPLKAWKCSLSGNREENAEQIWLLASISDGKATDLIYLPFLDRFTEWLEHGGHTLQAVSVHFHVSEEDAKSHRHKGRRLEMHFVILNSRVVCEFTLSVNICVQHLGN